MLSGIHASARHGSSSEFSEHKEYSPGDDIRHLDWRAFARIDRDFIKRFEDETNITVWLVVDHSASMNYPLSSQELGRLSKIDYAKTCAGALSYVLTRQADAIGLAGYSESLAILAPPRSKRGQLQEIFGRLDRLSPSGATNLADAAKQLSEGLRKRALILFFTDLFDNSVNSLESVTTLAAQRHDVAIFHILDSDERLFPFEGPTRFHSPERAEELTLDADTVRISYLNELERFVRSVETACNRAQIDYVSMSTNEFPGNKIAEFLVRRQTKGRR